MSEPRILIAGIGNIFLGDDGFGVEVTRKLAERTFPKGVKVVDFGIRGLDLVYALLDGYDAAILVDALPRGGKPGDLYLIEPEIDSSETENLSAPMIDVHNLDPVKVLRLVNSMGGQLPKVLVVGCEPLPLESESDMFMGLSDPVLSAVGEAVKMIESLLADLITKVGGIRRTIP